MKFLLLPVLMALVAVAQVFCEDNDPIEGSDYWTSSNQIQVNKIKFHLALSVHFKITPSVVLFGRSFYFSLKKGSSRV